MSNTRYNAVKHGILSEQSLIHTGDGKEDPEELQRLGDAIREDLVPIGATEQLLVEDIIIYWWRKRRLLAYESRLINGQWDARAPEQQKTVIVDSRTGEINTVTMNLPVRLSELPGMPDSATSETIMRYEKFFSDRINKSLEVLDRRQAKRLGRRSKGRTGSQD